MPYHKSVDPYNSEGVIHTAERKLLMPDANALTRELTATILENYGLLDEQAKSAVPSRITRLSTTAMCQKASALCLEVQELCAQAAVLCHEAEQLCKPRL